nr:hypothetical protein CFP56_08882 [Quercus suber]
MVFCCLFGHNGIASQCKLFKASGWDDKIGLLSAIGSSSIKAAPPRVKSWGKYCGCLAHERYACCCLITGLHP